MTSISTRKTAKVLMLAAVAATLATAQISTAATTTTRGYPTSTYPTNRYPVYQRNFSLRSFAQGTLRTTFVSGGATLPAVAYEGSTAETKNPSTPVAGSVFGYFESVLSSNKTVIQYCQTGSGFGKKVYDGLAGASAGVNGPCAALGVKSGSTNGFGAPAALGLTDPDMDASDSPLAQSEYSQFVSAKAATRGEPVELPEIVGAISLFYNNPDTGTTQIHLTDAEICGMVTGSITNWSQLGFKSRALSFVYRSDGSGTTFSFSNHLTSVCTKGSVNASQQFAPVTPPAPPYVVAAAPPGSIGASGNPGVVSAISSTVGAIGYAEAANSLSARNAAKGINFALVNGFDPIKNLPEVANKISGLTAIVKDSIVVTAGGAATTAAISPAPAHAGCVLLVKPSAYSNLTGGYPIIAVSYHLYAYKGNGANDTNLRTLSQELTKSGVVYNNQSGTKNITTVDGPTSSVGTGTTGFSALPSSFQSPVKTASNACIGA